MAEKKSYLPKTTIPSFIAAFSIIICAYLLKYLSLPTWGRVLVALIPTLPTIYLLYCMIVSLNKLDELQRKIQIEGFAIAFAGTSFLTLVYGMLLLAKIDLPEIQPLFIYVLMVALYGVGTILSGRRYQ